VNGIMLRDSKNFLTLSKQGVCVVSLGSRHKIEVVDGDNHLWMMHSFESMSYLKIEPSNMISFYCQDSNNRQLAIEHEYKCHEGTHNQSTHF
jgi:hypothetical protein